MSEEKDKKTGKKIDVNRIDLDRMKEFTTENPGILPYAHTIGAAVVKAEDKGKVKGRAMSAMKEQTDAQMKLLYEQMETIARQAKDLQRRVDISSKIYECEMRFEPLIGHIYHLYVRKNGKHMLSMIAPEQWGKVTPFEAFLASVKLNSDYTWTVLDDIDLEEM